MQKFFKIIIFSCLICFFSSVNAFADNLSEARGYIKKAKTTAIKEEGYEYIHKARALYEEEYEKNPTNIETLLGLSTVYQLLQDRSEAKLYVLKAYNLNPADANLQKAMGDFFYSFQEYSTAIEYYKSALASGLLKDFETNLQSAKCYEKLGDLENAELYYQISLHVNSQSRAAMNKVNEYTSKHQADNTKELEEAKYKYLFKDKKISETEKIENEAESIIKNINDNL